MFIPDLAAPIHNPFKGTAYADSLLASDCHTSENRLPRTPFSIHMSMA